MQGDQVTLQVGGVTRTWKVSRRAPVAGEPQKALDTGMIIALIEAIMKIIAMLRGLGLSVEEVPSGS